MASPWHDITVTLPVDASTVWVRRVWYSDPFKAVWSLALQQFTATVTGLICPWYVIVRWRNL